MRVLVCGGREYSGKAELFGILDRLHAKTPITCIIHGAASGADILGMSWAAYRSISYVSFPAAWKQHGLSAGMQRNQQMLDEGRPDLVLAFPGGTGTHDMISRARQQGFSVIEIIRGQL